MRSVGTALSLLQPHIFLAAFNKLTVPITLAKTKSSGLVMDLSTWLELEEEEIVLLGVSHVVHDVLQQIDLALVAAVLALCHDLQQQWALRDHLRPSHVGVLKIASVKSTNNVEGIRGKHV